MKKEYICTITKINNGYVLYFKNMISGKFKYEFFDNEIKLFEKIQSDMRYL